jgi:hypothetical protein
MSWSSKFCYVPIIKYLPNPDGHMDVLEKEIKLDPSLIESYEPVMFDSNWNPESMGMDGGDKQCTLVRTKGGNAYYAKMGIAEFESLVDSFKKAQYGE